MKYVSGDLASDHIIVHIEEWHPCFVDHHKVRGYMVLASWLCLFDDVSEVRIGIYKQMNYNQ